MTGSRKPGSCSKKMYCATLQNECTASYHHRSHLLPVVHDAGMLLFRCTSCAQGALSVCSCGLDRGNVALKGLPRAARIHAHGFCALEWILYEQQDMHAGCSSKKGQQSARLLKNIRTFA